MTRSGEHAPPIKESFMLLIMIQYTSKSIGSSIAQIGATMSKKDVLTLNPGSITLWNKFVHTIGCDPAVTVKDIEISQHKLHTLPIVVDDEKKGTALATVIRSKFTSNVTVRTAVRNSKGQDWAPIIVHDEDQTMDVLKAAFTGNPLFVEVAKRAVLPGYSYVFVIMTKSIVQFFNDDLSDYYYNFNGVTAQVLSELIWQQYANNTITCLTSSNDK